MSIYKGNKLVAGGSIDTHFVRRPAWNQAVEISEADLTAGYKAPADGMFVGALYNKVDGSHYYLTLNGTNLMPLVSITGAYDKAARPLTLSLTVNQGDIIGCTAPIANIGVLPSINFVPFEDSTVSESNVEVVTPELIRNLHDPDWSQAVSITADQLSAGYTAPGRGIVVGAIANDVIDTRMDINVNGVAVAASTWKTGAWISYPGIQVPVNKNDVMTVTFVDMNGSPVQVDIASSREVRLLFVPYKAQ